MRITRDTIVAWLTALADALAAERDHLTALDAAIGDADHGVNMDRGFQAVKARLPGLADQDIGAILKAVGMTLVSTVGGASGPLYGTLFLQMGLATAGKEELTLAEWQAALQAGVTSIVARGRAQPGDKTMVDALTPALAALAMAASTSDDLPAAMNACARAARAGMLATIPLVARKGRASYLGERAIGHQDPGATSAHLLLATAAAAFAPSGSPAAG